MSDKMMEFDEWCKKHDMNQDSALVVAMFHDARSGMISAENAVVIPDGVDWPVWAAGIASVFTEDTKEQCEGWPEYEGFIHYIPRPKPVWVPRVGEAVFVVRGSNTDVSVCRFSHIDEHGIWRVVTVKGQEQGFTNSLVRPFNPDHIGKPWSEIPGGVE